MLRLKCCHTFQSALACHHQKPILFLKLPINRTSSDLYGHNTKLLESCIAKCINVVSASISNLRVGRSVWSWLPTFQLSALSPQYTLNWFTFSIDFLFIFATFSFTLCSQANKTKVGSHYAKSSVGKPSASICPYSYYAFLCLPLWKLCFVLTQLHWSAIKSSTKLRSYLIRRQFNANAIAKANGKGKRLSKIDGYCHTIAARSYT